MVTKQHSFPMEGLFLSLALILANLRALIFVFLFPDAFTWLGGAWIEIYFWAIAWIGVFYILIRIGRLDEFLGLWRKNWILILFISFAFLSILWSVKPVVTLFRILELLFATLIAAYIGTSFSPERIMKYLFWFGASILIISIALVYGAPRTGTMYWAPFNDAWRGIFWHRNHLASLVALLSAIYFVRAKISFQERDNQGVLDVLFYVIALLVLFFAKSATGYILFLVLHGFLLLVIAWLKFSRELKLSHYLLAGLSILVTVVLMLFNQEFVFSLFNRSANMSGRVELWTGILKVASSHRWLGHGFGAFWTIDANREQIRQLAGWTSQPLIADNGLLDIYLHLGVIGVTVFVIILVLAFVRTVQYAIKQKTVQAFLPLLIMVYALFANISFSMFAETEVFIWFLIIAALFMTTPKRNHPPA